MKQELQALMAKYGLKGHLLLFLDNEKIRFLGDLDTSALLPLLMKQMLNRS